MSNPFTYVLPPGFYYVGDPCYAIKGDGEWEKFLKATDCCKKTEARFKRLKVLVFRTTYGDGVYYDDDDNTYGVDSGCIAFLPLKLTKEIIGGDLFAIYNFQKGVKVYQDECGIRFNNHLIDC